MEKSLDRCSSCAISAGISLTHKLLRKIAPDEAKSLMKKFENSRIGVKKYFSEARKTIRDFGTIKDLKAFDEIQRMIREEG